MNNYGTYEFDTNETLKTRLVHLTVEPVLCSFTIFERIRQNDMWLSHCFELYYFSDSCLFYSVIIISK